MRNLNNAVAVVTGAGSGIGRALAQEFASRGARLALADINTAGLEETRRLLGAAQAKTYPVDVSSVAAVEELARQVQKDFGGASLLINNAGVALLGTFAQISLSEMKWLIDINFWGTVYACKFFIPLLEREPEAHIVNLSSVFGLIAPAGQTAYASSKFAVRGFTQALRQELSATRIQVTCVHPAGIQTRIAENARSGAGATAEERAQALERFKKLASITPKMAAQVIIKGILRDKARVLIGADAYVIDVLQRFLPVRSTSIFASLRGAELPPASIQPQPAKAMRPED
jgi:NAD(P)-dependent dehydrogenase (short-subunit alcohol dehydrogenase family)